MLGSLLLELCCDAIFDRVSICCEHASHHWYQYIEIIIAVAATAGCVRSSGWVLVSFGGILHVLVGPLCVWECR